MAKRELQEINAGSMADIAFLLLIFFLVTTTMNVDTGITRMLPPPPQDDEIIPPVNKRNVFIVLINKNDQLAIEGQLAEISEIRQQCKDFFANPANNEKLSVQKTIQERLDHELSNPEPNAKKIKKYKAILEQIGNVSKSDGVISLQNDRGTSYGKYIIVQNEIVGAINELRDELSKQTWGKEFNDLNKEQQGLIKEIYPFAISEAPPVSLGD